MSIDEANDGGSAFPLQSFPLAGGGYLFERGMSLRDWFAGQALGAIIREGLQTTSVGQIKDAEFAYAYADAMLAAREAAR